MFIAVQFLTIQLSGAIGMNFPVGSPDLQFQGVADVIIDGTVDDVFSQIFHQSGHKVGVFQYIRFVVDDPQALQMIDRLVVLQHQQGLDIFGREQDFKKDDFALDRFVRELLGQASVLIRFGIAAVLKGALDDEGADASFAENQPFHRDHVDGFL